jgi:hypothetical protein
MNNKLIISIGILTAAILLTLGVYTTIISPHEPIDDLQDNNTGGYIESSQSDAHLPKLTVDADKLERNAKPSFEVGKKYKYQTAIQEVVEKSYCTSGGCITKNETITKNMPSEFAVEKMEKFSGKECYVVSRIIIVKISEEEKASRRMNEEVVKSMEESLNKNKAYYYYDKETGECVQIKYFKGEILLATFTKDRAEYVDQAILFSDWMLALNDDFMWERTADTSDQTTNGVRHTTKEVYTVKGREKVNGRECFKVEINSKTEGYGKYTSKSEEVSVMWIDVKERIMVKSTTKYEGLSISETELINEQ